MAKSRSPAGSGAGTGVGSEYIVDATQIPTAISWTHAPRLTNTLADGLDHIEITDGTLFSGTVQATSADFVFKFTAKDNGRIEGITLINGSQAIDGSNGWELDFVNVSQSNASCAYFGFGSGTEAAKATDKVAAVSAGAVVTVSNSVYTGASHFSRGDVISLTADRDGTAVIGTFIVLVSYESQGHV